MSKYGGTDSYTYPNTDILRNRADIRDQAALDRFEADTTAVRSLELTERPIKGLFDLAHLQAIHRHLFQDIYEWAGEFRTVDISKGTSRFANLNMIENYLGPRLKNLQTENFLRGRTPEFVIDRLAHYMGEINATHPFREGNGRAQRAFCSQLADEAGSVVHGDDNDNSDLDILIDPTAATTLMDIAAIQVELEKLLGVQVDVLTPRALPEKFRATVLFEAVPV